MGVAKLFPLLLLLLGLLLPASCSKNQNQATTGDCTSVDDSLKDPKTVGDTLNLINALPKPAGLDCFLNALKPPLKVFATNSSFSAQPAQGNSSPRIFILKDKLVLSVVPAGSGRMMLELGESYTSQSYKAEIQFPVENTVTLSQIVDHLSGGATNTSCASCHFAESKPSYQGQGPIYLSNILRPDESQRVSQTFMKIQAETCNSETNKYRCDILKAIYINGQATDASFSY